MVVVMAPDATDEDIAHVVERVESVGGEAFVSKGVTRTIIGLVGDIDSFHHLNLRTLPGVADVHRISDPYKLVSRAAPPRALHRLGRADRPPGADRARHVHLHRRAVRGRDGRADARGGADGAGGRGHAAARRRLQAAHLAVRLPGPGRGGPRDPGRRRAPRPACRSSPRWSTRATSPVVAEHADMLQIGTRNMANFGLLQAVGEAGKPVLLKRGMTATIEEWLMAAEYIAQRGNLDVVLCERGIRTFEPATRNTLDISAVPVVQADQPPAGDRRPVARRRPPGPRRAAGPRRHRRRRRRRDRRRAPRPGVRPLRRPAGVGRQPTCASSPRRCAGSPRCSAGSTPPSGCGWA